MPSTFFGLTIAGSGLNAYQTAVNTTANNISNSETKGYSRQEALLNPSDAIRVNAKYGSTGTGVEVTKIQQIRNEYYDLKYWTNTAKLGEQSEKKNYLTQLETYLKDEETVVAGQKKQVGFTSIFGDMFNALDTLKTDAASLTTRTAFISSAQSLADYFNSVSTQMSALQKEINDVLATKVEQINGIGQKIASITYQINIIEQQGGYASELRDERNLLVDELSALVPVEVTERDVVNSNFPDTFTGATTYVVKINGQKLVDTFDYSRLVCVPRQLSSQCNKMDEDGLYDVYWTYNASTDEPSSMKLELNSKDMTGQLKALYDVRDGNNNESFSGKLALIPLDENAKPYRVTISDPSIIDPRMITMPESGTIYLENKAYHYSEFALIETKDATTGEVGYTYEFVLSEEADGGPVSLKDLKRLQGCGVKIGENVDFMGIPYYQQQLNEFVRCFSQAYNEVAMQGVNLKGEPSNAFFVANDLVLGGEYGFAANLQTVTMDADGNQITRYENSYYYSYLTAKNFTVCKEAHLDAGSIATSTFDKWVNGQDAYDIIDELKTLKDKAGMFRGGAAGDFLQCLLSDISVDTQKAEIFTKNYENLNEAILNQRMSESSVDKDEEALNLVKFQNAYNLSSKLVQVLQEMYDRLILETGA